MMSRKKWFYLQKELDKLWRNPKFHSNQLSMRFVRALTKTQKGGGRTYRLTRSCHPKALRSQLHFIRLNQNLQKSILHEKLLGDPINQRKVIPPKSRRVQAKIEKVGGRTF